jgi:hypothetical protein
MHHVNLLSLSVFNLAILEQFPLKGFQLTQHLELVTQDFSIWHKNAHLNPLVTSYCQS